MGKYRISADIGGTFTDIVVENKESKFISTIKSLLKSNVFINSHKGNTYKKTNQILRDEFDNKKNPAWLRLRSTISLKVGLGRVIKPLLKGEL